METILYIPNNPDAPIACDMSAALDTADARLEEYRQLFTRALLSIERQPGAVEFRFAHKPGVRDWCADLATREAACCPFLSYHLTTDKNTISWTTSGDEQIEAVRIFLDMFQNAPIEFLKTPSQLAGALEQHGFVFVDDSGITGFKHESA